MKTLELWKSRRRRHRNPDVGDMEMETLEIWEWRRRSCGNGDIGAMETADEPCEIG